MKTKLTMMSPENTNIIRDVEITGAVILPENEYQDLFANGQLPDRYRDRLNNYSEAVVLPRSTTILEYKALLVMGDDSENGIAVCGKNYVSYAANFPGAKEWLHKRIKDTADIICDHYIHPDENNQEKISFEKIGYMDGLKIASDNGIGELLRKELYSRQEIADIIMTENCYKIDYSIDNVQNYPTSNQRTLTLLDLIVCNLHDVHLIHDSEEHDFATIVDLTLDTLTEKGTQDWSDVLNAKVENISNGYYGIQIDLSGVEPKRLRDFSYMLAGHCSSKDYDRWVNDGDDYHDRVGPDEDESSDMVMQ